MQIRCLIYLGLLVSQGLALSFMETLFPFPVPVPGAKLGLANAITLVALYTLPRTRDALIVTVLRVLLGSFFFGGPSVLLYSLSGAVGSLLVMQLLRSFGVDVIAVSAAGGIAHNICQLAVAMLVLGSTAMLGLLPLLGLAGLVSGAAIGWLGKKLLERNFFYSLEVS